MAVSRQPRWWERVTHCESIICTSWAHLFYKKNGIYKFEQGNRVHYQNIIKWLNFFPINVLRNYKMELLFLPAKSVWTCLGFWRNRNNNYLNLSRNHFWRSTSKKLLYRSLVVFGLASQSVFTVKSWKRSQTKVYEEIVSISQEAQINYQVPNPLETKATIWSFSKSFLAELFH